MDRRSLLKAGVAAGLAACGTSRALGAAANDADEGTGKEFGLQFAGLFVCRYSPTDKAATIALPSVTGHAAYLAADLRYVDGTRSDAFDFVVAGPGAQQLGVWKVKGAGDITLTNVTGSSIAPTGKTDTTKCPGSSAATWQSVSWLADISKIQNTAVKLDPGKVKTSLNLTQGQFGAVMPANLDVRGQKFVVVDDQDQDVMSGETQLIDQPLASAIFYRGTISGSDPAVIKLPTSNAQIYITGISAGGFQAFFSHLPDKFSSVKAKKRRLEHFEHYYTLLKDSSKKYYPGIGNPCGMAGKFRFKTLDEMPGGAPNIEPIFCPPAVIFEP
jgi:hypothetical protein